MQRTGEARLICLALTLTWNLGGSSPKQTHEDVLKLHEKSLALINSSSIHFQKIRFQKTLFQKYTFRKHTFRENTLSENTVSENTRSENILCERSAPRVFSEVDMWMGRKVLFGQVMSPHHSLQMSQRSQVSRIAS